MVETRDGLKAFHDKLAAREAEQAAKEELHSYAGEIRDAVKSWLETHTGYLNARNIDWSVEAADSFTFRDREKRHCWTPLRLKITAGRLYVQDTSSHVIWAERGTQWLHLEGVTPEAAASTIIADLWDHLL